MSGAGLEQVQIHLFNLKTRQVCSSSRPSLRSSLAICGQKWAWVSLENDVCLSTLDSAGSQLSAPRRGPAFRSGSGGWGGQPSAVAFDPSGRLLLVSDPFEAMGLSPYGSVGSRAGTSRGVEVWQLPEDDAVAFLLAELKIPQANGLRFHRDLLLVQGRSASL